jgi:GT2 family glycosyltransferase
VKTASVTVNWGSPDDTIVALHSLALMTRPPDFIVCVDNGSPAADVSRLRSGMPKGTVLIELGDNMGVAAANNAGMEYALSHGVEWTLLLNNDATVTAQCLDRCLAEATATAHTAIVGPAVAFTTQPDSLWFAGGTVSDWFAYPRHRGVLQPADSPPPSSDVGYVSTCCALLSSEAFRSVGPFRSDYFMYYDETEWCQRARKEGWRCRYLGEVLCAHAVSATAGTRGSEGYTRPRRHIETYTETMAYYLARNPLRFALETPQMLRRLTRVIGILAVYGSFNAWQIIKSRRRAVAEAYVQGLADAFRGRMGKRPGT